jgi:hypothetical protein
MPASDVIPAAGDGQKTSKTYRTTHMVANLLHDRLQRRRRCIECSDSFVPTADGYFPRITLRIYNPSGEHIFSIALVPLPPTHYVKITNVTVSFRQG